MNNFNFANQTPSNINASYQQVGIEALETVGEVFYGITFSEGDVIEFPSEADIKFWLKGNKGTTTKSAYVNAAINDKLVGIPVGSFRKVPCDDSTMPFLDKYEVNKELYILDDDAMRARTLMGRKLRVKAIVSDIAPVFTYLREEGKHVRAIDSTINKPATKQVRFYVFEWVK